MIRKAISLLILIVMMFSLAGCGQSSAPATQETEPPTPPSEPLEQVTDEEPVNVMVLNGTTGFGMANLIVANSRGEAALNYNFSVETDASNVTAALINGDVDIAALPTNAAAVVYNKTGGDVQVLALNTLGVLYLVTDGSVSIESFEDLKGLTVYAPAQNPSFIFQYLCEANGLVVGEDVIIDNLYAQPADLNAAISSGEISLAVLPEPLLTVAMNANDKLSLALDLTAQWDMVSPEGSLVQGCVVVRRDFAEANPEKLKSFLDEYEISVAGLTADLEETAQNIEASGVFAKAAVAKKAIPNCNVCFITGEDMKTALSDFHEIMFSVAPASVGGAVPADDFYCIVP